MNRHEPDDDDDDDAVADGTVDDDEDAEDEASDPTEGATAEDSDGDEDSPEGSPDDERRIRARRVSKLEAEVASLCERLERAELERSFGDEVAELIPASLRGEEARALAGRLAEALARQPSPAL